MALPTSLTWRATLPTVTRSPASGPFRLSLEGVRLRRIRWPLYPGFSGRLRSNLVSAFVRIAQPNGRRARSGRSLDEEGGELRRNAKSAVRPIDRSPFVTRRQARDCGTGVAIRCVYRSGRMAANGAAAIMEIGRADSPTYLTFLRGGAGTRLFFLCATCCGFGRGSPPKRGALGRQVLRACIASMRVAGMPFLSQAVTVASLIPKCRAMRSAPSDLMMVSGLVAVVLSPLACSSATLLPLFVVQDRNSHLPGFPDQRLWLRRYLER